MVWVYERRREQDECPTVRGVAFGRNSTLAMHIDVVHLKLRDSRVPVLPRLRLPDEKQTDIRIRVQL